MNTEIEMPIVTEDDVRAGEKSFPVRTRKGETVTVKVKAVSWSTSMKALALGPGESAIAFLKDCLSGDQARDAFLDCIVPEYLIRIASVSMQLTNGVDAAKQRTASSEQT